MAAFTTESLNDWSSRIERYLSFLIYLADLKILRESKVQIRPGILFSIERGVIKEVLDVAEVFHDQIKDRFSLF